MAVLARCALASFLACTAVCGYAAEGSLLPAIDAKAFVFNGNRGTSTREQVSVSGQDFASAVRITVGEKPEKEWQVNTLCAVPAAIAKGDALELTFWARSAAEDAPAKFRVVHQLNEKPWSSSFSKVVEPTSAWKRYSFTYAAKQDYAAKGSRVALFLGLAAPQTVEIAAVSLVDKGQDGAADQP